jgi:hypothetical protein
VSRRNAIMRSCIARVTAFTCLLTMSGCSGPTHVAVGMSEEQVLESLGAPSRVITERELMGGLFFRENEATCVPRLSRVLFYDRWFSKDLSVGISENGRVLCTEVGRMLAD